MVSHFVVCARLDPAIAAVFVNSSADLVLVLSCPLAIALASLDTDESIYPLLVTVTRGFYRVTHNTKVSI